MNRPSFTGTGSSRRRAWVLSLSLLLLLPLSGCGKDTGQVNEKKTMSNDLTELKRLIKLPADVKHCEWQTGKLAAHGGDWWVAAVLDVSADKMPLFLPGTGIRALFETPPGLNLASSFAALKTLPDAQVTESQRIRLITETFDVAPYANSPLLSGKAIRLSANQVLVVLWTN